jgi:hypothetical protein
MQTMGVGDVLFIITQTWQDGLIMQRDLLREGYFRYDGQVIEVTQIYEHQWIPAPRPVCLMVDWEILYSAYQSRITIDKALQIPDKFPVFLIQEMRRLKIIPEFAEVRCVVKDKTRIKGSDMKISKHFMFHVAGLTLAGHYQVQRAQ